VIKFGQDVKNSIISFRQNNSTMKKEVILSTEKEAEKEKEKCIYIYIGGKSRPPL
jgi:hypothetical protein